MEKLNLFTFILRTACNLTGRFTKFVVYHTIKTKESKMLIHFKEILPNIEPILIMTSSLLGSPIAEHHEHVNK